MSFAPQFEITNSITAELTGIERARGFLDAAKLSEDWIAGMQSAPLCLRRTLRGISKALNLGQLYGVIERALDWQAIGRNQFVERLAGQVLHHHEIHAILRSNIVQQGCCSAEMDFASGSKRARTVASKECRVVKTLIATLRSRRKSRAR